MEMRKINSDRLVKLFEIIVEKIRYIDDEHEREENIDFYEEMFSNDKIRPLQYSMMCCTLALRLFLVISERNSHKSGKGSLLTSLPEVIIEQNLAMLHKMFVNNFSEKQSSAERMNKSGNVSPSRNNNGPSITLKDLVKRKVIDFVVSCSLVLLFAKIVNKRNSVIVCRARVSFPFVRHS